MENKNTARLSNKDIIKDNKATAELGIKAATASPLKILGVIGASAIVGAGVTAGAAALFPALQNWGGIFPNGTPLGDISNITNLANYLINGAVYAVPIGALGSVGAVFGLNKMKYNHYFKKEAQLKELADIKENNIDEYYSKELNNTYYLEHRVLLTHTDDNGNIVGESYLDKFIRLYNKKNLSKEKLTRKEKQEYDEAHDFILRVANKLMERLANLTIIQNNNWEDTKNKKIIDNSPRKVKILNEEGKYETVELSDQELILKEMDSIRKFFACIVNKTGAKEANGSEKVGKEYFASHIATLLKKYAKNGIKLYDPKKLVDENFKDLYEETKNHIDNLVKSGKYLEAVKLIYYKASPELGWDDAPTPLLVDIQHNRGLNEYGEKKKAEMDKIAGNVENEGKKAKGRIKHSVDKVERSANAAIEIFDKKKKIVSGKADGAIKEIDEIIAGVRLKAEEIEGKAEQIANILNDAEADAEDIKIAKNMAKEYAGNIYKLLQDLEKCKAYPDKIEKIYKKVLGYAKKILEVKTQLNYIDIESIKAKLNELNKALKQAKTNADLTSEQKAKVDAMVSELNDCLIASIELTSFLSNLKIKYAKFEEQIRIDISQSVTANISNIINNYQTLVIDNNANEITKLTNRVKTLEEQLKNVRIIPKSTPEQKQERKEKSEYIKKYEAYLATIYETFKDFKDYKIIPPTKYIQGVKEEYEKQMKAVLSDNGGKEHIDCSKEGHARKLLAKFMRYLANDKMKNRFAELDSKPYNRLTKEEFEELFTLIETAFRDYNKAVRNNNIDFTDPNHVAKALRDSLDDGTII